ncbi:DUF4259 domain-containing protein [Candidatus Phycosocius spiralis]|uniref:DUF4259 domain-containing protein n=1 Tax=Candidatus Phycosocius spiralis TaxID=2815099 RepID=A0ABQ4PSN8_9PROT|nr:DUF4259 domain-containing protein [Candidatus Phycosocius spiralis]GIU66014.1 hypothetical protein PsB1_0168 [Candidatus Phycosocius spiralis]
MGAWGTGYFENDDAMDWAIELEAAPSWEIISMALSAAVAGGDYLEVDVGSIAIAASAVFAGKLLTATPQGPTSLGLPKRIIMIIERLPAPTGGLAAQARSALTAVISKSSELFQLWQEADPADFKAWRASVLKLLDILPSKR